MAVAMKPVAERQSILLVGDSRLRRILTLISVPTVLVATSPLDAMWTIEQNLDALQIIVVSSSLPWRDELTELLANDYPEIRALVVTP